MPVESLTALQPLYWQFIDTEATLCILRIISLHGLINGTVDIGIDGFPLLCCMCLNNIFFPFGHYKIFTRS